MTEIEIGPSKNGFTGRLPRQPRIIKPRAISGEDSLYPTTLEFLRAVDFEALQRLNENHDRILNRLEAKIRSFEERPRRNDQALMNQITESVSLALRSREEAPKKPINDKIITPRQVQVLELLADGYTRDEIASQLSVGPNTVKNHIAHIKEKLRAKSQAEAVAKSFRSGLLK